MNSSENRNSAITPRSVSVPESARVAFDSRKLACEILRTYRSAALSTLDPESGYPYGSVTDIATDHDGTPIFLLAGLALHTRNIAADNRVSMVVANLGKEDALSQPRLTLVGKCFRAPEQDVERLSFRFLMKHPKAKLYLSLPDVRLYRFQTEGVQLSAGPGRNAARVTPQDLKTSLADADKLLAGEERLLLNLNGEGSAHLTHAVSATGNKSGKWKATGIDPEGIDLADGYKVARFWFSQRVTDKSQLLHELG